jgi:hypothetical protein
VAKKLLNLLVGAEALGHELGCAANAMLYAATWVLEKSMSWGLFMGISD